MPCSPGVRPVPRLAKDDAVVEGKAESSQAGTAPCPEAAMDLTNGVWAAFCLRRLRPRPSASTTHTRWDAGNCSLFSKPGRPMLAAALVKTSAIDLLPYRGAAGSSGAALAIGAVSWVASEVAISADVRGSAGCRRRPGGVAVRGWHPGDPKALD